MANSDLSLQLARPEDATVIAHMSRDLIEYGLAWRWTAARIAANIRDSKVNVLVARVRGHVVGFAIMGYGDHVARLNLLAVAPEHRRSGIASELLGWLEKCAVVAGMMAIKLEVRARSRGAQLFYESMGYRRLIVLPGYYQGVEPALRMGRSLARNSLDHNASI